MQHEWLQFITPLPRRAIPFFWEDLASLISRLAERMGYKNPAWILHPEEVPYTVQPYTLCQLRIKTDYHFFEQLLRLDEECLYNCTLHRFASHVQPPELTYADTTKEVNRPLLTRYTFQSLFHPYSATKVCPRCLAEEPRYGRLYWSAQPVIACLQHNVLLIDTCPDCLRPIPALRLPLTRCPRCKRGDYRKAVVTPLPEDALLHTGQMLLLDRLGVAMADQLAIATPTSPLPKLLPHQYFQLLDAFHNVLRPFFPDAPFLHISPEIHDMLRQRQHPRSGFSPPEWSIFIATFHALFASWPDTFFTFLDLFPVARKGRERKRDQESQTGVQRDFGIFYERWLYKRLSDPAFAFLHEAFEDYLKKRYTGGEISRRLLPFKDKTEEQWLERGAYLTKVQTKALLGIGEDTLQSLLKQGALSVIKRPLGATKRRTMYLVDRVSVEALRREWNDLIPLDVLTRSLFGVTKAVVLSLEKEGLLLPRRGPGIDGYKVRLYRQEDIEQFEKALLSHAETVSLAPVNVLPLPKVSNHTGVALVEILKEVFDHRLRLLIVGGNQSLFQRLVLPVAWIPDFLKAYKQRQYKERGLLTLSEAANYLGVGEKVLRRWARDGLLESEKLVVGGKQPPLLFRLEIVKAFRSASALVNDL